MSFNNYLNNIEDKEQSITMQLMSEDDIENLTLKVRGNSENEEEANKENNE